MMRYWIGLLSILTLTMCNSDKSELVKQFDDLSEENNQSKVKFDPFFENGIHESWFLMGSDSVGGFIQQRSSDNPKIETGHYFVKSDFTFKNIKKVKIGDIDYESHYKRAFFKNQSIIAVRNNFNTIEMVKSIDRGGRWFEFYFGQQDNNLSSNVEIYLNDHDYDNFFFFNEYKAVMALSTGQESYIYEISESGKDHKIFTFPGLYVNDLYFQNEQYGMILCRTSSNTLPSVSENAYLMSTPNAGYNWTDTLPISHDAGYDKFFVKDLQTILSLRGNQLFASTDGGYSWEYKTSYTNSTLELDSEGNLFKLDEVGSQYPWNYYVLSRSVDFGANWGIFSNDTLIGRNPHLEFDQLGQALVYFGSGHVYVSKDGGRKFEMGKSASKDEFR